MLYKKYTGGVLTLDAERFSIKFLFFTENGFPSRFRFVGTEIFPNFASASEELCNFIRHEILRCASLFIPTLRINLDIAVKVNYLLFLTYSVRWPNNCKRSVAPCWHLHQPGEGLCRRLGTLVFWRSKKLWLN